MFLAYRSEGSVTVENREELQNLANNNTKFIEPHALTRTNKSKT